MISFVILNYKSLSDTIECIESINKINTEYSRSIIVVDNGSMNQIEKQEILNYTKDVVFLEENIGFAKGNNVGCKYAIEKYNPDFLCVLNADIIINQKDFVDQIYCLYEKYNFDILGPKILPNDSESNNPFNAFTNIDDINHRIKYTKKLIYIYQNPILVKMLNLYINFKKIIKKNIYKNMESKSDSEKDILNVPLHGCAMIFSKKYYKKYENIFYDKTFLFHEEEFIFLRCKQGNLKTLYSPKIELFHKEGQSVKKQFENKNTNMRMVFRNKEILKSLNLLKDAIEKNEKI